MANIVDIMQEYSLACYGDWNDLGGDQVEASISLFITVLKKEGLNELPDDYVKHLRHELDICLEGKGHWSYECSYLDCGKEDKSPSLTPLNYSTS